ncbi:hypothetical protein RFI_08388 [Reticulomyxa filosa]|uniref:V-SNARE coiled-coil homology domain-containing protein n=1 Tax=Reticulomyxa filosa TaxID=46433 RepID=X6NS25_RETFI|nr:hypothetical protein RFI_08388 [Reticulomyxa filosa]|eukprot:ETO28738.1 hypothetical protein RFI_08388 [Reticulomyxa filosa]
MRFESSGKTTVQKVCDKCFNKGLSQMTSAKLHEVPSFFPHATTLYEQSQVYEIQHKTLPKYNININININIDIDIDTDINNSVDSKVNKGINTATGDNTTTRYCCHYTQKLYYHNQQEINTNENKSFSSSKCKATQIDTSFFFNIVLFGENLIGTTPKTNVNESAKSNSALKYEKSAIHGSVAQTTAQAAANLEKISDLAEKSGVLRQRAADFAAMTKQLSAQGRRKKKKCCFYISILNPSLLGFFSIILSVFGYLWKICRKLIRHKTTP